MRGFWLSLLVGFNVLAGIALIQGISDTAGLGSGGVIGGYVIFAVIGNLILWFPYKAADKREQGHKLEAQMRECPHCKVPMRRDASVCPHCQRESEAWKFFEGRWWAHKEGEWVWLDASGNWVEVEPAAPPKP